MPVLFLLCIFTLCLLLAAGWKLKATLTSSDPSYDTLNEADTELNRLQFYRPMERLLSEDDFAYVSSQPNISPAILKRMRAERRRIFRQYLGALSADFSRLTSRLREIMVESPCSREDLAASILRARMLFAFAVLMVEGRLVLHACGFYRVRVSALVLTEGFAQMQREMDQLTRTPALSAS